VTLHSGRYGPYVSHNKVHATLPRGQEAPSITLDEALALLAAKADKPAPAGRGKRVAASKATTEKKPAKAPPPRKPPPRRGEPRRWRCRPPRIDER